MKKYLYISVVILSFTIFVILFLNLINGHKSGTLICKYNGYTDNNQYTYIYNVKYKDRNVINIISSETIISDDSEYLEKTKNELENQYYI